MDRASVPGWQLVEHWLVGEFTGKAAWYVLRDGRVSAVTIWSSTLLGPEGTGESYPLQDRDAFAADAALCVAGPPVS
jgi:hypothetical protein